MRIAIFILLSLACLLSAQEPELLRAGAIADGSSFCGIRQGNVVSADYYFDKASDGDPATFWLPMEQQGPHEIVWTFRTPVSANRFRWSGDRIQQATLLAENGTQYQTLGSVAGNSGEITFPATESRKFKLVFGATNGLIRLFEAELFGPPQLLVPKTLPALSSSSPVVRFQDGSASVAGDRATLTLAFDGSAAAPLPENLFFLIRLGDRSPDKFRNWAGDIRIADFAARPTQTGGALTVNPSFRLPHWTPPGVLPWFVECYGGEPLRQYRVRLDRALPVLANGADVPIAPQTPQTAELGGRNGQRGFVANGTFRLPFFMRYMRQTDYERMALSRANGIDLQYFMIYYSCLGVPEEYPLYFARLDQQIRAMLKLQPEALFLIGMDMRPDRRYLNSHPAELMRDRDGTIIVEESNTSGLISFGSADYLAQAKRFLDDLIDFVNRQEYANRVIGYQPWINSANDAFIGGIRGNNWVGDRAQLKVGDHNPQAVAKYREFLGAKYGSDAALRQAWGDPAATLDQAPVPAGLVAEDAPGAVFRNAAGNQAVFDYWEFFPSLLGNVMRECAAHIKLKTNHRALVFMHYGAVLSTLTNTQPGGSRHQSNNNDFHSLLTDPNIDMFVQSFSYQYRHAGEPMSFYQPIDSLNLHGKMYLSDYDARTISTGWMSYGRHRSIAETDAVLARDFSFLLLKNSGAWLSDMAQNSAQNFSADSNSWFAAPEITRVTSEVLGIFGRAAETRPKQSVAEIAVWVDLDSVKFEDTLNAAVVYRNLIRRTVETELNMLGAPFDIYLLRDVTQIGEKAEQYKLHLFLNAFSVDQPERDAIELLKQRNATLMWFYAPGYLDGRGNADAGRMQSLTGISVTANPGVRSALATTLETTPSPLTAGLAGQTFRAETYSGAGHLHPESVAPSFFVADTGCTVIGRDGAGRPNLVLKNLGGWRSVYSVSPFLPVGLLRNIAQAAGVHLYTDRPALMMADNRFLVFHNGMDAPQTLTVTLPQPQTILDGRTGETVAGQTRTFQLPLPNPSTRILERIDR